MSRSVPVLALIMLAAVAARAAFLSDGLWYDEIAAFLGYSFNGPWHAATTYFSTANHVLHSALVAASADAALCERAVEAFHGDGLRVYTSADPTGVEVGGAVKNVMAIAAGLLDGLAQRPDLPQGPGLNARAALVTRGLAEMTRLGVALGARAETFMGLSGLGDLVLTATGALSRNRRVGLLLAEGRTLAQALDALGHVAEGVYTAATVLRRAQAVGVEMPITAAVVDVLQGRLGPEQAMARLMAREARAEG